jgi:hypothetical protein
MNVTAVDKNKTGGAHAGESINVRPATGRRPLLTRLGRAAAIVGVSAALLLVTYMYLVRPWHMRWGATDAEVSATLPGDDLVPVALQGSQSDRAITIAAPPEAIWPWLVQLGQAKGGWYSYETLENLLGCQMTNADSINPEWQNTIAGDNVGMYPEGSGPPPYRVAAILPNRAFIMGHPTGDLAAPITEQATWNDTWAFVLEPVAGGTRLVTRTRWAEGAELSADNPIMRLVEPGQFIMDRGMLWGIKERAERSIGLQASYTSGDGWGVAFMLIAFFALVGIVFSKRWPLKLALITAGAGLWWIVLFFGYPSLYYSGLVALAALAALVWSFWPGRFALGSKWQEAAR